MQKTIDSLEKLSDPIPENQILWKVGKKSNDGSHGQALPYIDNRHVQNRLDELFGKTGWKNVYTEVSANGKLAAVRCTLLIKVGDEWIGKEDAAPVDANSSVEFAVKGAYSDAMKRAAVQWGFGRYLYEFRAPMVELDEKGRLKRIPLLTEGAPKSGVTVDEPVQATGEALSAQVTLPASAALENAVKPEVQVTPAATAVVKPTVVNNPESVIKQEAKAEAKTTVVSKPAEVARKEDAATAPPSEHAAGAVAKAEAQADAAAAAAAPKLAPAIKVEATPEPVKVADAPVSAQQEDGPPSDLYVELVEKIKKLPTAMIRRYIEGPKGQDKLTAHERESLLGKIVAREAELAAA